MAIDAIPQRHLSNGVEISKFHSWNLLLYKAPQSDYFGPLDFGIFGNPISTLVLLGLHLMIIPIAWFGSTFIILFILGLYIISVCYILGIC
jgi:phosphotransferase system  glucose/maltose/N-acetylglucosamine-specific IIC component